ncbi:1-aminocyclopropane-1-carboxylate deaminase/D-cysteine desulfhydrase [Oceanisphaera pacifica]|uniref:Pyridoxal-phosphate dependent enzyme n=1 Tax=Oceanisphaera pacifica TaxID=2818389 RepID=A0ABS3NIJ0_9GAMM|nr:pyridoxal-phosphate dependent enzyme [Oceanisphaera pacifica]MBO1520399.1 pyridoxal-phosphate dependent enzyme [Oceanisphaera pacifica]
MPLSKWYQLYCTPPPAQWLQLLHHPLLTQYQLTLWVARDDLRHTSISGNKWRKLKYILRHALLEDSNGILSFGGAYSNHLHALASAGHHLNLPTLGIVRGEASSQDNPTLSDAQHWGMQLAFVDRQQYRRRQEADWLAELSQRYPKYIIVPEGGSCDAALPGVAEVWQDLRYGLSLQQGQNAPNIDHLIVPVASGGTLAGLLSQRPQQTQVTGYAVLKGARWLSDEICRLYPKAALDNGWRLALEHHGGGYAKCSVNDKTNIDLLAEQLNLPLEPIYSGKALLGLFRDIAAGLYPRGSQLVFLHTGGLQGARGTLKLR